MRLIGCIALICFLSKHVFSQGKALDIPVLMIDVSYANSSSFLKGSYNTEYTSSTVNMAYDYEAHIMFNMFPKSRFQRNHFYVMAGYSQLRYDIEKKLYDNPPSVGGHFNSYSTFSPNKLNYKITVYRPDLGFAHYTFYKYVFIFQKLALYYNLFDKKDRANAYYSESYGSSYPVMDPAYITPDNPDGWHTVDAYTYTGHNDMDTFKNNLFAYYKFGVGARIGRFSPFIAFEFSEISRNIPVPYFNLQAGIGITLMKRANATNP